MVIPNAILIYSIAWYTAAIRLKDTKLENKSGRKNFFLINTDSFWKNKIGNNKTRPIRHLEKRRIKSDEPKSKEVFADDGTIAKHSEDNKTTKIPKVFFFLSKLNPK